MKNQNGLKIKNKLMKILKIHYFKQLMLEAEKDLQEKLKNQDLVLKRVYNWFKKYSFSRMH